jgi:hypothetical protein
MLHFGIPIVQWQPAHSIDFGMRGRAFSSMPQLFPTQPGKVRATGSRDSVDERVTGFGSEQSRPNLKSALRLGGNVSSQTNAPPSRRVLQGREQSQSFFSGAYEDSIVWGLKPGFVLRWHSLAV